MMPQFIPAPQRLPDGVISVAGASELNIDVDIPNIVSVVLNPPHRMFSITLPGASLDQTSVDNIFTACDAGGEVGGFVTINRGTSAAPSAASATARANLDVKGWSIITN